MFTALRKAMKTTRRCRIINDEMERIQEKKKANQPTAVEKKKKHTHTQSEKQFNLQRKKKKQSKTRKKQKNYMRAKGLEPPTC